MRTSLKNNNNNLISAGISIQDNPDSILKCDFWWKEMQGHVSAGLYIYALFFFLFTHEPTGCVILNTSVAARQERTLVSVPVIVEELFLLNLDHRDVFC